MKGDILNTTKGTFVRDGWYKIVVKLTLLQDQLTYLENSTWSVGRFKKKK